MKVYTTIERPAQARVWTFLCTTRLTDIQQEGLAESVDRFLIEWASHGAQLSAWCEIHYNQVLVIALDESMAPASGCSQDALMRQIQLIENTLDISLLDRLLIPLIEGNVIQAVSVNQLPELIKNDTITPDTPILNMHIQNYAPILNDEWIISVSQSWMKRYFL